MLPFEAVVLMPRALEIPEILEAIFEVSDEYEGAVSARVCRFWSWACVEHGLERSRHAPTTAVHPLALDQLRRRRMGASMSPCTVFRFVDEITASCVEQTFHRSLHGSDWRRWRDLVLALDHSRGTITMIRATYMAPDSFTAITWIASENCTLLHILPFVSDSVRKLSLIIRVHSGAGAGAEASEALECLGRRTNMLAEFHLTSSIDASMLESSLCDFLRRQTQLVEVTLPQFSATKDVVDTLG